MLAKRFRDKNINQWYSQLIYWKMQFVVPE